MIMTTQRLVRSSEGQHMLPPEFMRMYRRMTLEGLRE